MASTDVFPPNNLGPDSSQWGREMERTARANEYALETFQLSLQGANRASAGQMGVIGQNIEAISSQQTSIQNQIDELGSRGSGSVTRANLSVAGSSTTVFASATGAQTVPGEAGGARQNIISFVSGVSFSSGTIQTSVFVRVLQGSTLLLTARYNNGGTFPSGWTDQVQGTFVYPVDPGGTSFTIQLQTVNFNAGTQTTTLTSPTFSYVRADKV